MDELVELVNLTDARRRPLGGFSGGMRQRVGIAQAAPGAGADPVEPTLEEAYLDVIAAGRTAAGRHPAAGGRTAVAR